MSYQDFLTRKGQWYTESGFYPLFLPDYLKDFQEFFMERATTKARSAVFSDCGTGKTVVELVFAENVARKTGGNVLVASPLSVSAQTVQEGEKFGIEAIRSKDGSANRITVTNYEKLHLFNPSDFVGFVGDESSILKNFQGVTRETVTQFIKKMEYRLLCTATAAPNDYTEMGTTSEALGYLGFMDMLNKFFKNAQNTADTRRHCGKTQSWRFKGHAEKHFWRYICSFAVAIRKPSDLGFDDNGFILPSLIENDVILPVCRPLNGKLFPEPAANWREMREEIRLSIKGRCEKAAELAMETDCNVTWCNLNDEGDLLEKLIPGSVQIHGRQSDDQKEEIFQGFSSGDIKKLIIKPKIGAFGLNWQHCNHAIFFPTYSYEQYYQAIRRFWRFGQDRPVRVDRITTEGGIALIEAVNKKARKADKMFDELVKYMNDPNYIKIGREFKNKMEVPSWL